MIEATWLIYDQNLRHIDSVSNDRGHAEVIAKARATEYEVTCAVMLAVPVAGTDMPELRAVRVYDYMGNELFRNDAYESELVPA